jgi:hypothetical protein
MKFKTKSAYIKLSRGISDVCSQNGVEKDPLSFISDYERKFLSPGKINEGYQKCPV